MLMVNCSRSAALICFFSMLSCSTEGGATAASDAKPEAFPPLTARDVVLGAALRNDAEGDAACKRRELPIAMAKDLLMGLDDFVASAARMSAADEARLGKQLASRITEGKVFRGKASPPGSEETRRYLQRLVDDLAVHAKPQRAFKVFVIDDPSWNAFALPGGVLGVHTGLLEGPKAVRSEAELGAVLAHEIAHVTLRHSLTAFLYAAKLRGLFKDVLQVTSLPDNETVGTILSVLRNPVLSTAHERAADREGLRILIARGYSPIAAADLWRRQQRPAAAEPRGLLDQALAIAGSVLEEAVGTHPPTAARICAALKTADKVAKTSPKRRFYIGRRNLADRVAGSQRAD